MNVCLAWWLWFLPLGATAVLTVCPRSCRRTSAGVAIGAALISFALSLALFWTSAPAAVVESSVAWLNVGSLRVDLGLLLDPLSRLMLLVVTGVAGVIEIYSWGYLREERSLTRYYAGLSFFLFAMLGVILAPNFIQMFATWELVGVSSWWLIGFWYDRPAAAEAAKKAILTNRIGDAGFFIGILMIWATLGTVHFGELRAQLAANPHALWDLTTLAALLVFCGVLAKSAQFPLHVWLPDAMEGPTPVSALIHAATMVAAGVYLLGRVFFLFALPTHLPEALAWLDVSALDVVAWTGAITALLAALLALQQDDFKRILAYSTLSQLGYMVLAAGLSGVAQSPAPALYHLVTHACFKALLFLGAGSVIVALHHEQNIWKMGGLWRQMPITTATFLAGALALCGAPPFSGFFSKDEILALAYAQSPILFGVGVAVALLTAFYMTRLILVAFFGPDRLVPASPVRESAPVLTVPLMILAVPALLAGFFGILPYLESAGKTGLDPRHAAAVATVPVALLSVPVLASLIAAGAGFGLAWRCYRQAREDPLPQWGGGLVRACRNRFYLDDLYQNTAVWAHDALGAAITAFDQWIVSGLLVRGAHGSVELLGRLLRLTQTGQVQTQVFLTLLGVLLVLYWALR